ncbi:MAG: phenylalanine--tRNA ligase subunit alpha [Verrucomicrobiota bacterium]
MEAELKAIVEQAQVGIRSIESRPEFEQFKAAISGPRGSMTQLMKGMGQVPKEQKPVIGRAINEAKKALESLYMDALQAIEQRELEERIGPAVDPTLPSLEDDFGSRHPINAIREELVDILKRVGFAVAEGPEVDTEWFCFDALNTAPDHPARDLQDTLYMKKDAILNNVSKKGDERYLLRTHTSTVQIRTMLENDPPIRVISPGRVFRRDTVDATHSSCFHQIEALYVDKNVTVADLKALLDYMMRELLGKDARTRFRPHFFPYTEPSFELDCSSSHLKKVGKTWTEMGGCGMVDPTVFEAVGYDPDVYSGYAFGFGLERLAMILYGIDDIRHFYQNDLRFLRQFA